MRYFCVHAVLIVILIFQKSLANVVGNDTQTFNPTSSGLGYLTVQGSQTLDTGLLHSGFFLIHAKNILPDVYDPSGNEYLSSDSMTYSDFSFGYGLNANWDLGLSISSVVDQQTDREASGAQFKSTGLNEIRIGTKYNFLKYENFGLAVLFSVNLNLVKNNPFLGKGGGITKNIQFITEKTWGFLSTAANVGYRFRDSGKQIEGSFYLPLEDQFIASIGASYYFPNHNLKAISEIYGSQLVEKTERYPKDFSSEFLLGIKYEIRPNTSMHIGGGGTLSEGTFTPETRIYVGFNYIFQASESNSYQDRSDVKINITQSKYGYQPTDVESLRHTDFDQIQKIHEFVVRTAIEIDAKEKEKPPFEVIRLNGFDFDFGSSEIRKEYEHLFKRLSDYLNSEPQVLQVRVEGHTDSIGSPDRNRLVSQARADSTREKLIESGALPNLTFKSIGFGSSRPIADNSTNEGRKANRRVEIRILRIPSVKSDLKIH